ncbi:MAG: winged helix-turn-helix domain-containing protein, partial [Pseudomonadota bacterium]
MPFTLDPGYREHSTDRQWQILQAVEQYGGQRAAARALGVHQSMVCRTLSAVRAKAAQQGFAPEYDLTVPVAPGFFLKGTSTLYDMSTGEGRLQWVKTDRDREALEQMARDWVAGLSEEISRAPPLTQTEAGSADLLNLLVIADAHFGMLADEKETGADWNVEIAERTINRCFEDMLARAPAADEAVIAFLGDLSDINDIVPVTPKSGNVLDAERLGRVVPVVSRTVRRSVDMALRKHRRVHLKVMEGNHDRAVMLVMADGLKAYYENEPRVTVDDSGIPYYAHQFGRTMLAFHHGDMVKPPQIPITFAS